MSADLAGALWLLPGQSPPHNLRSTRVPLASRIAPGQSAAELPGLLAGLFSLCGQAHRLCNRLALAAAGASMPPSTAPAETLRRETASEHLRRIALDWPRLLAPEAAALAFEGLPGCPLLQNPQAPADWGATAEWLQARWLGMPPADWLKAWDKGGRRWLDTWSRDAQSWLGALLRQVKADDMALPALPALRVQASPGDLRELARALQEQGDAFCAAPRWRGCCAHTGCWSRMSEARTVSTWALLGWRIAELARLCGAQGALWLQWGAWPTGDGRALAWIEMARGLLVHHVTLEPERKRVTSCQVLAPTEWNFHPEGIAAQALAHVSTNAQVHLLMAALDPCVPFRLDSPAPHERGAGQARHA